MLGKYILYGGFPKMVGLPNNHGVFHTKMIILGCEMEVPPFKETPNIDLTKLALTVFVSFARCQDVGDI